MLHLTDSIQFMQSMQPVSVDCIVTDPPYRTISGGKNAPLGFGYRNSVLSENNGKIFEHNNVLIKQWMPEMFRVLRSGGHCYVMTNTLNLRDMLNEAENAGFRLHNLLVWKKNTGTPNRWYMKFAEYVLFLRKGPAEAINNAGSSNIFQAPNPRGKAHPTEKPVELFEHYILNSTEKGDLVFDPFAGSGASLVAAVKNERKWLGCEIDPMFYYPALARIMRECNT